MADTKAWHETQFTYVWIFSTGRGLSVCIRFPQNIGILYDLGCSEDFSPTDFVLRHIAPKLTKFKDCSIAQVVMSHPHLDHIQEVDVLLRDRNASDCIYPQLLTCPHDKEGEDDEAVDFTRVNNPESAADTIEKYRKSYESRSLPLQTITSESDHRFANVEYGIYYLRPASCDVLHENSDQDYTNALSLLLYLRHGYQSMLIPGDITPDAFRAVLSDEESVEKRYTWFDKAPEDTPADSHAKTGDQPALADLLADRGLSVLVAPHHGLESGFCQDVFDHMAGGKPALNVISEKRHLSDTDGKVDSRCQSREYAQGVEVDVEGEKERRYSVSTMNGHHLLAVFRGTGRRFDVYSRANPEDLLTCA